MLGLLLATKEAVKLFGSGGGSIINISSVAADSAPPHHECLQRDEGGGRMRSRARSRRNSAPQKIRVNSVNPGMVETEGTHAAGIIGSDFRKQVEAQTPLGRIGQPQDIAPDGHVPGVRRFGLDHRRNALHLRRAALRPPNDANEPPRAQVRQGKSVAACTWRTWRFQFVSNSNAS